MTFVLMTSAITIFHFRHFADVISHNNTLFKTFVLITIVLTIIN
jgi:hypothetical protein